MNTLIILIVLSMGVIAQDDSNYWRGYASSVIATPITLHPVEADIYDGQPKTPESKPTLPVPTPPSLPSPAPQPQVLQLPRNYREGLAYIREKKGVGLVVFSTVSCGKCYELKNALKTPEVAKAMRDKNIVLIYKLDCNVEPDIAQFFNVKTVPFYILTDGNGVLKKGWGYFGPQSFAEWLK